ncbi:hypothetical protein D1970_10590 [Mesobacillus zeae]|uniref:Uncharacterized protein n=2 Tax=Mesobacillus zeae TaxID=1917180 RepID=A0A398B5B0_9BACI|nr:hypothetical protein D1970_10590 [Mesobacillus zeae]
MKSKLEALFDDKNFSVGVKDCETGVMINEHQDLVTYMFLFYQDSVEVFLSVFDEDVPYGRDILAKGAADTLDDAVALALDKLE